MEERKNSASTGLYFIDYAGVLKLKWSMATFIGVAALLLNLT